MGKEVQSEKIIEIPIDTLKDALLCKINEESKFNITNLINESNGYVLMIKSKKSMKSYGEKIIIILESVDEYKTKVYIKSKCVSITQIFDWNVNQENIDVLFSMMKTCEKQENIPDKVNLSLKEKYLEKTNKNINSNHEKLKEDKPMIIDSVSCIYCGGHERVKRECSGIVDVYSDRIEFRIIKKQFEVPISAIINNEIVTYDQVVQRLTATRIMLFGIFAAAMPKRKMINSNYIEIDFEEYGVKSTIVFRGDGSFSFGSSSDLIVKLNSIILKARKEYAKTNISYIRS